MSSTHKIYLPYFGGGQGVEGIFGQYLLTDPRQERSKLLWNCHLAEAAKARVISLATLRYWAHCDPSNKCVNTYAREAGCKLPSYYGKGNNIESLVAGTFDPLIAFTALANSPAHADHLFGRTAFFREQMHYGIAFLAAEGSVYHYYWCILIGICLC